MPKKIIKCPHCSLKIVDNSGGRFPCAWCGKHNAEPDMNTLSHRDPKARMIPPC